MPLIHCIFMFLCSEDGFIARGTDTKVLDWTSDFIDQADGGKRVFGRGLLSNKTFQLAIEVEGGETITEFCERSEAILNEIGGIGVGANYRSRNRIRLSKMSDQFGDFVNLPAAKTVDSKSYIWGSTRADAFDGKQLQIFVVGAA